MKNALTTLALAAALGTSLQASAFDFGSLFGSDEKKPEAAQPAASNAVAGTANNTNALSSGLLDLVSSQLDVSKTQAAGGVGALMGLANSSLPAEYSQQLNQLLPGLDNSDSGGSLTSSLLGGLKDMDSVKTAFSALGMDSSMVDQFIPVIESYLGDQDAGDLVNALSSVWS